MQKMDVQTALTQLENRLLKAEGRIFGLTELIKTLVVMEAIPHDRFKLYVEGMRDTFKPNEHVDKPTATFVEAARDLMRDVLKAEVGGSPTTETPRLSVIEGGKSAGDQPTPVP